MIFILLISIHKNGNRQLYHRWISVKCSRWHIACLLFIGYIQAIISWDSQKPVSTKNQARCAPADSFNDTENSNQKMISMTKSNPKTNFTALPAVQTAYAIFIGALGSLLILLLMTGFMPLGATVKYLPWILGFQSAVGGYSVTERCSRSITHIRTTAAGAGMMVVVVTIIVLNLLSWHVTGMGLIYWAEAMFFIIIGFACGGLGSVLSIKAQVLKKQ